MAKAKRRKDSSFKSTKTKSIFLYGNPNKAKAEILCRMQSSFLALTNRYISLLDGRDDLALQIVKNDKKDSVMRALEKSIRLEMLADNRTVFTKSKVLFAMTVSGSDKAAMETEILSLSKKDGDFYCQCAMKLKQMDDSAFRAEMAAIADSYTMYRLEYKRPELRSVEMPLDSRLMRLERSGSIKAPFVISITDPFRKRHRFAIPLDTSRHSLHKAESNPMAGTVKASVKNGQLRIAWSYDRHFKQPATSKAIGVDTGIVDALYASDGHAHGSMKDVIGFYKNAVEPAFAGLSDLRNKKRAIRHYLRRHKDIPDDARRSLISKMDRLEHMMQTMDAPYRKKRRYYGMLDETISKAVDSYVSGIDQDTLTVIERLDIKEFDKSRRVNGMFSTFARGRLQAALMEALNWKGYDFMEVDPAYTSQVCPVCGNLDSDNRSGKVFRCTCCGHEDDADHVASVNIRDRAGNTEILSLCEKHRYSAKSRQTALRDLYRNRHNAYLTKQNPETGMTALAGNC